MKDKLLDEDDKATDMFRATRKEVVRSLERDRKQQCGIGDVK